jgi:hypothetical protein
MKLTFGNHNYAYELFGIPASTARDVTARLMAYDGTPIPYAWDSARMSPEGEYKDRQPFASGFKMKILMTTKVTGSFQRTHIDPLLLTKFLESLDVWCQVPKRFMAEFDICYPQLGGKVYTIRVHNIIIPKLDLNFPVHDFVDESFDFEGTHVGKPIISTNYLATDMTPNIPEEELPPTVTLPPGEDSWGHDGQFPLDPMLPTP